MKEHTKIIILVALMFTLGQAMFGIFAFNAGSQNLDISKQDQEKVRQVYGTIDSIDPPSGFLVLSVVRKYKAGDVFLDKIYFDEHTKVFKKELLAENGVIYAETDAVRSSIDKVLKNSRVSIEVHVEGGRFYASKIYFGTPFPVI